jgi:maleylacetate reductase
MQDFVYQTAPMRVVFGTGTLRQLPEELTRLGVSRALVLATLARRPWWAISGT